MEMKSYEQLELEIVLTSDDVVRTSVQNFNSKWFDDNNGELES